MASEEVYETIQEAFELFCSEAIENIVLKRSESTNFKYNPLTPNLVSFTFFSSFDLPIHDPSCDHDHHIMTDHDHP